MVSGKRRQYLASFVCQLSTFVTGVAYGGFEPITIRLTEDPQLSLSSQDVSWIVALIEVGSTISPLISGKLSDRIGRKRVIQSICPLCFLGWALILFSKSMLSLSLARFIHGLGIGVAYTVVPIYIAEIADPDIRGRLAGSFQTAWFLGKIFAFSLGPFLSYDTFVYVCLPMPIISMIAFCYMPETPYYLLMTKQVEEATKVLKWFGHRSDIVEELTSMQAAIKEEMSQEGSWTLLITNKVERKALIVVLIVCVTKDLTGFSVITNYALETFSKSHSTFSPEVMSIALAFLLAAIAIVSACMSDRIGRKPLLLMSCFGSFFSHLFTGGYYYLHEKTSLDARPYVWMMYLGMAMYCFFSGIGLCSLVQTLHGEMFGSRTRGVASGITECMAGLTAFFVLLSYRPVNEAYGLYLNFWFYGVISIVGGLLLTFLMYETAGKVIGRMER